LTVGADSSASLSAVTVSSIGTFLPLFRELR
jgi:hypothetical protein